MMTPDMAIDLIGESLNLTLVLTLVLIVPGLLTGLVVALFQAATQINEQTLAFLPRLLVTLLVVGVTGRWMVGLLMDFCVSVFERAAQWVA
ncbi:flagellar biosynthesis protein FliQ [Roseateles terrae]|uniref:Flagellar biosynthetic protein FliQ n=1 Tax=Roseateles terrae TaxID=431060 RepID=A0ABR6GPT8_9BURK|nr:flagellar biosynthesis protein FliQ [Roseateles terrae]MBB3194138.1 flagellar biosynthetic protein FliQ [Roseateles terrae]OWQ87996.1 flagellar biosynthetic protein FliQ [Roseateles terrae]